MNIEAIPGTVENGSLVDVVLPSFSGRAGMRVSEDGIELAIFARAAPSRGIGTVDGQPVRILSSRKSAMTRGAWVIVVEPIGGDA